MTTRIVEARALSKTYPTRAGPVVALEGVSFALDAGEVVAVVGPSGSGKTTLLNLVSGLDRPTSGDVEVLGQRLHAFDSDAATDFRRRHIGFVFQFFNLIPTMSAAENVALPLLAEGASWHEMEERVAEVLSAVGLSGKGERRASQLSGGEMQRVAIARALVMKPALILADEPTGNLDSVTGDAILDLLCTRARQEGRAVLLVTHSYLATAYAGRVLVVRDGRLVDELTPADRPAELQAIVGGKTRQTS